MKKEVLKKTLPFFKAILYSLNPSKYEELIERRFKDIAKYFLSIIFLAFIVSVILMTPKVGVMIDEKLSGFESIDMSINATMQNPVVLFPNSLFFTTVINTNAKKVNTSSLNKIENVVTNDYLYHKKLISRKVIVSSVDNLKELKNNKGILLTLIILMLPSLLFLFYLYYLIKILLFILIATCIALIVCRVSRLIISFFEILKIGLFASTALIIIDVLRLPFDFSIYYAQYIVFLVLFIIGIVSIAEFEDKNTRKSHKRKKRKKEYIEFGGKI